MQSIEHAMDHLRNGRMAEAEAVCRQILAGDPRHAAALHWLGVIALRAGRVGDAVTLIERAVGRESKDPIYRINLALAQQAAGNLDAAMANLHAALSIDPRSAEAHNNYAVLLERLGRGEDARAHWFSAVNLDPTYAAAYANLGASLQRAGELRPAIGALHRAVQLEPRDATAQNNFANAMKDVGMTGAALAAYDVAVRLRPDYADAHFNRANLLQQLGRLDEAVTGYESAIRLAPDFAGALNNLANALKRQGRLAESLAASRRAVAAEPTNAAYQSNLCLNLHYSPRETPHTIAAELRRWRERHADPLKSHAFRHDDVDRDPDRRLRIGYVSAELHDHMTSYYLLPLLEHHDRDAFEVFVYASVHKPDAVTARLAAAADVWRDVARVSDADLAKLVREDRVDVLIDLGLHTGGSRLLAFARKPAPVQVSWLGYPGSTGLDSIDYRLTDRFLDPPDVGDVFGGPERLEHLPDCFWCYTPPPEAPEAVARSPRAAMTFGCFNACYKVNDDVIELWSRVLRAAPGSRMQVLAPAGSTRDGALGTFETHGVSRDRVEFVAPRDRRGYFELYHGVDVALDTFPYNGHTTSLDALYMGVPVVTLMGDSPVGRAGMSQLYNLGMPQWAATTSEAYVTLAISASAERGAALRQRMRASSLMDAPRFTRGVEAALRRAWRSASS
jgi:predicted O-linked N-acetylglucosamine transferase (SPINDLY family)